MGPATKRRKLAASSAVPEITFDDSAREDFLTGFHKRKVARIKTAQELAVKKGREELLKARAKLRARRKEELEAHVRAVNEATGILVSSGEEDGAEDEEWEGIPDVDEIDREEEYVDEARYTTVTVESVDITKDGFARPGEGTDEDKVEAPIPTGREAQKLDVERRKKDKDNKVKKKIKKKKFRYEGKIERRLAGDKERSKNSKQAAARKENPTTRPARKEKAGKRRGGKK